MEFSTVVGSLPLKLMKVCSLLNLELFAVLFSDMCRDQSKSQVASETGTEDWGQEDDQQGSNANWSSTTQDGDKAQSPQTNNTQGGEEMSTAKPTQDSSSSGSGEKHKDTMVFSLSRDNDLVTHYTSKRGKARGRGQRSSGGPTRVGGGGFSSSGGTARGSSPTTPTKTRFAPPKPGSGGITVIEPLEKRLQKQQQNDQEKSVSDGQSVEGSPSSARPISTSKSTLTAAAVASGNSGGDTAESANKGDGGGGGGGGGKNRPGSGRSPSSLTGGQPAMSKPKRYSSQRQKGWSFCFTKTIIIPAQETFKGELIISNISHEKHSVDWSTRSLVQIRCPTKYCWGNFAGQLILQKFLPQIFPYVILLVCPLHISRNVVVRLML